MLLQFSVTNFKTFKEKATLSFIASNYDKDTREVDNIYFDEKFGNRILKSAVIFGANASGKSKLLDAFATVRYFVLNSSKESQKGDEIDVEPFKLNTETENEPCEFEVIFIHHNIVYRYGFEVTKKKVVSEWLFQKSKVKEVEIFYRDEGGVDTHDKSFTKGRTVVKEGLVRDNALLLSVAAQFNDPIAFRVIEWFERCKTLSGLNESGYRGFTLNKIQDPLQKKKILELLNAAGLDIEDVHLQRLNIDELPKEMPKELRERIIKESNDEKTDILSDILMLHKKYDEKKRHSDDVYLSLDDDESSGTRKFFALTGPILDVIEHGYTLVVDELDSKLHPNLVCKIVSIFNSKELNRNNAQLIFNTHDTNLLSSGLFRRDQIWFTDKSKFGEAKLYSLSDFKDVRKTESFEDNYIRGKYGAIPYLGFFDNLDILSQNENEK